MPVASAYPSGPVPLRKKWNPAAGYRPQRDLERRGITMHGKDATRAIPGHDRDEAILLENGTTHPAKSVCPLHNRVFDLSNGTAQGADEGAVNTFSIRVDHGRVLIDATLSRSAA